MLIDSHIHVGQFHDTYYSPTILIEACKRIGISHIAVSSLSVVLDDSNKVLGEFEQLLNQKEVEIIPVLWITPKMLQSNSVSKFLDSGINWKCIKIHNYLQGPVWGEPTGVFMQQAVSLAQSLHLPILMHTGNDHCYPDDYKPLIAEYPDQIFILAHSRPVDQTIAIMKQYSNAWADTAFTPTEDIQQIIAAGLADRLMWGTDLPLMSYYDQLSGKQIDEDYYLTYYHCLLDSIRSVLSTDDYEKLVWRNALKIFKI